MWHKWLRPSDRCNFLKKIAIILFNLGGPDKPESIEPFLFNLFVDPAIITLPNPFRWMLAKFISSRRRSKAELIYAQIGGRSPIRELSEDQALALQSFLNLGINDTFKTFISMRYWHPMSDEVAQNVADYAPDEIILLPLYPQFSTTTTGSSIKDWERAARAIGLNAPTKSICCYPTEPGWIAAQVDLITTTIKASRASTKPFRLLFSAHGLPQKTIDGGDPYQEQVEQTCHAIMAALHQKIPDMDCHHRLCYQSKVGRLKWIGPSLDDEIKAAGNDNIGVIVVPVAFVSEHSETLVELDIEYREIAHELNIPFYERVPAVGVHENFIRGLAQLIQKSRSDPLKIFCGSDCECGLKHSQCPHK